MRFEERTGFEVNIWMFGCAGFPSLNFSWAMTSTFSNRRLSRLDDFPTPGGILSKSVRFGSAGGYGQPKSEEEQQRTGVLLDAYKTSIRAKLLEIGERCDPPFEDEGSIVERSRGATC